MLAPASWDIYIEPSAILFGNLDNDFDFFSKNIILLIAKEIIWTQTQVEQF